MEKRWERDRNRTEDEIVSILSQICPVNPPDEEGMFEVSYNGDPVYESAVDRIVLDKLLSVLRKGFAYKSIDIYYLLKYTTDIDELFADMGFGKWSYRPGSDVTSARIVINKLWKAGKLRKFAKGFYTRTAGGRPYGVHYQVRK